MRFAALLALPTPVAAATMGWMAAPVATAQPLSAGRPTPAAIQPSPPVSGSPRQVGLDTELRALAGKLGVSVPNEADDDQLGQVVELSTLSANHAVRAFANKAVGVIDTRLDLVARLVVAICTVEFAATLGLLRLLRSN